MGFYLALIGLVGVCLRGGPLDPKDFQGPRSVAVESSELFLSLGQETVLEPHQRGSRREALNQSRGGCWEPEEGLHSNGEGWLSMLS